MLGTVTVVDPNAPDYPVYDIATVTTVDADGVVDSSDVDCQIEAIVYGVNLRPSGLEFTVIDDSGNGIKVFKSGSDCYEVTEGDRLIIQGEISQFNGLTQISPAGQIDVLSSGNALLDPISINEPLSEATESKFIWLESLVIDTVIATGSSGWNVTASGENDSYAVRLDSDAFDEPGVKKGDFVGIKGIGGQFDNSLPYTDGYQIGPRGPGDIDIFVGTKFLPASSIRMYPNPVSDIMYFETDLLIESVRIFNTSGALIALEKDHQLNVSTFLSGVYVVKVYTADGVWTDRFVKVD